MDFQSAAFHPDAPAAFNWPNTPFQLDVSFAFIRSSSCFQMAGHLPFSWTYLMLLIDCRHAFIRSWPFFQSVASTVTDGRGRAIQLVEPRGASSCVRDLATAHRDALAEQLKDAALEEI